jgi:hypothetical protein
MIMNRTLAAAGVALVLGLGVPFARASGAQNTDGPDRLVLKTGSTVHGLIVRNTASAVVLQEKDREVAYPKSAIARIYDEDDGDIEFTRILQPGHLPSWRVIANDLRSHDSITSVTEIPPARIEQGMFRNIPYKSFRINKSIETNIYGNAENPVALEIGLYGGRKGSTAMRRLLRGYMAGYLSTREEIAALYSLDLRGGKARADPLALEIIPPNDPRSHGTWWICLYREDDLDRARVPDAAYAAATIPAADVRSRQGRLPEKALGGWAMSEARRLRGEMTRMQEETIEKARQLSRRAQDYVSGFFRDKDGNVRLLPFAGRSEDS